MGNYLNLMKRQQVISLLELGWTYRRIEVETGVRRETVSRYDRERRSKPAKVFPGSEASSGVSEGDDGSKPAKVFAGSASPARAAAARAAAAAYKGAIEERLEQGLTAQRIWQDLVEDYGYGASYESVKRFIRSMERPRLAVGVYHSEPGEEGQIDFFKGAPTLHEVTGQYQRPWVFRITLCCSRHGYEEAIWGQKLGEFLRVHENAFHDLGGVPRVVRHDNLKAAVTRACFHDPDSNDIYLAFAKHWGFTPLPTRPRNPKENGKQERSGGYVKDNALKGRRFESLREHNEFLVKWNRTIARLRIHGTTRKQVWSHFAEVEKPALLPLAAEPFPFFESGMRVVHIDGHIEVAGSFYPVPPRLLGETVRVRWDRSTVRVYSGDTMVTMPPRIAPGLFAPRPGGSAFETTSSQKAAEASLLGRCARVGDPLLEWAQGAIAERGVRAYRVIQGVLNLTRSYTREQLLCAAEQAATHNLFRSRDMKRLVESAAEKRAAPVLTQEHESIRSMDSYRLEDFL